MDRFVKVCLGPAVFGLIVAAGVCFALAELWQWWVVGPEVLVGELYERAMEDRGYHARIMEEVADATYAMLFAAGVSAWAAALFWFLRCWRKRIAAVGAVRRQRPPWWAGLIAGCVVAVGAAVYVAFRQSQLSALIMVRPLVYTFLFLAPVFIVVYYAATVLCTHRVYLPAIPWSRWRPW